MYPTDREIFSSGSGSDGIGGFRKWSLVGMFGHFWLGCAVQEMSYTGICIL